MGFEVIISLIMVAVASSRAEDNGVEGYRIPKVPCYFIFGDSLADNGNNNELQTVAKVDYEPYGIDFPYGPTGRFTNGRTTVDVIGELLGLFAYIPPYASVKSSEDILFGVNYASGSAGILNETGQQLGERIAFDMQLENHRKVALRLAKILITEKAAKWYLSKCLYTVGLGNNDYINNYFIPEYYNTSQCYTLHQFTQLLIQHYTHQIKRLYSYGARKMAIFGLGSLGCTPDAMSRYGRNGSSSCVEIMNEAAILFNTMLIPVVDQLNQNLTDASFTFIHSYAIGQSAIGIMNTTSGCCTVASDGQCIPNEIPCQNRTAYVFWDSFHPTEVFNEYIARRSYQALYPSDAHPYDIRTLLQLDEQHSTV